jgi:hypothetical protein
LRLEPALAVDEFIEPVVEFVEPDVVDCEVRSRSVSVEMIGESDGGVVPGVVVVLEGVVVLVDGVVIEGRCEDAGAWPGVELLDELPLPCWANALTARRVRPLSAAANVRELFMGGRDSGWSDFTDQL